MSQAKTGDTVKVHYIGTLDDGTVFDNSRERGPLEFTIGGGQIIPGFEDGIVGMAIGDTKTITILAEEAYGPRHPGWPRSVGREQMPDGYTPAVGNFLQVQQPDGIVIRVMITNVDDESVTLDNHPLAGEALHFDIELVGII